MVSIHWEVGRRFMAQLWRNEFREGKFPNHPSRHWVKGNQFRIAAADQPYQAVMPAGLMNGARVGNGPGAGDFAPGPGK